LSNKRKKQHYVPQFYLKYFSNYKKQISILNISNEKIISNVPYMNQCYENYYYGTDEIWERKLSSLEGEWASVLNKINGNTIYYPTINEINKIKQFILFQKNRTLTRVTQVKEMAWKTIDVAVQMKYGNKFDSLSDSEKQKIKDVFLKEKLNKIPEMCLELADKELGKYIVDLELLIINYTCKSKLITSDNPIIHYNNFCIYNVGLTSIGIVIFFPVSPTKLIILYDKKMYPRNNNKQIININNDTEVKWLNMFQVVSSRNLVLFNDEITSDEIQKLFCTCKKERTKYFAQFIPKTLGVPTNQIVHHHETNHPFKYNFSFTRLISRAEKISKYDRTKLDNFPRKYEDGWKFKLEVRENVLPKFHYNFKNKESKKKIKEVNRFVIDYWNDTL